MQKPNHVIRNFRLITGVLMLIKLCMHLFTSANYELHRDEMLYFHQGDHLAWGYASVPPLIGLFSFLIKSVSGYAVSGIRLLPAILGTFSVFLTARIVRDLGGKNLALLLACTAVVLSPGFLIFHTLYTVNVFEQFFWLLISYLFFRLLLTENPKWWLWIGLFSGLAFLNKYLVVYLLTGFFIAIVLSPKRKLFFSVYFLFGLLTGLLIILPNLIWQYQHHWPIIFHISELQKSQMVNMTYRNFLADIFLLNGISTIIWVFGLASILFLNQERMYRFLGIGFFSIFALFLFSKGKAYYLLGIIPFLFAIGGYAIEKYVRGRFQFAGIAILIVSIVFSIIALPFGLPLLPFDKLEKYSVRTSGFAYYPFLRWEDGQIHPISQVYADMTGWKDLVLLVNKAYQQIPEAERPDCTIYAEGNYGYAGAFHFYGKSYGLPDAITFLDNYTLWAPDTIAKGPIIYIHYQIAGLDKFFEKCIVAGTIDNRYFRENGLKVFLCRNPNDTLQEVYRQKAIAEKRIYRR